ncbi:prephenate dehydrogenase/arogenate dehydrogenase family protein [Candidatus Micrarchaeota archaeon]|nr:prephenate dehydrogenase/arogenate dehydrogenase family protein [Candidatus Micrarchaeota archaeon]
MRISIIGGTGEFGRLYARLFRESGFQVCIAGRDLDSAKKIARDLNVEAEEISQACKGADVVIVSVPIEVAKKTIKEISPKLRKETLLMDFTSVKADVIKDMKKAKVEEVVACHPLHGPRVKSLEGQAVIFVPVKKGEKYRRILEFFEKSKARVYEMTAEEHDKLLAVVQSLTHFLLITTASALKELGVDVKKSRVVATPVYELALDLVARVIGQNPHVYAQIQMHNPFTLEVHKKFIQEAKRLSQIVKKKDNKRFIELMASSAKHFGNVEDAMAKSDKAIAALSEELGMLKELVGKRVALENIYTGVIHFGLLKEVTGDFVELEVGKDRVKLKVDNVRLLRNKDLLAWKSKNTIRRDFSFLFGDCEEDIVRELGEGLHEDILNVDIKDVYNMNGKKSVTLRFTIFAEADVRQVEDRIKKRFLGIGAMIR